MGHQLTSDELLAGGAATFTVSVPASLVRPSDQVPEGAPQPAGEVVLRPLLVRDLERVARAAKEQRVLASVLMVQQALVQPKLTVEQVGSLPAGLVQFLVEKVNAV